MMSPAVVIKGAVPFAVAIAIWIVPTPAGLTVPAWHLFAIFVSAIVSVLVGAYPLLTSTMLAVAAVVITGTISPAKAFGGFANPSVLLVVIAFLVAQAVVKSGLGRRISLFSTDPSLNTITASAWSAPRETNSTCLTPASRDGVTTRPAPPATPDSRELASLITSSNPRPRENSRASISRRSVSPK